MSRWILLPERHARGVNVVVVVVIGGGVTITEIIVVGESRIEDHVVKEEEIRTVGEVSNDNNHRRNCPKMWELNLWEGGMPGVILEEEVDLSDVMIAVSVREDLSDVMIAASVREVLEEAEETHPRDNALHSN